MTVRKMLLLVTVPAVLGLSACGGGKDDPGVASAGGAAARASASPSASLDPRDAQLKFAQCMRANGVDMPDPQPGDRGVRITNRAQDKNRVEAAMNKCDHYLQAGGIMPDPNDPKVRDRMLKFAQCMRQHGVDVPDPQPGRGVMLRVPKGSAAKVEAAEKACRQYGPKGGAK